MTLVLAAVLVGVSSFFVITLLRRQADDSRQRVVLITQLEAGANYESALEWQAIATGKLDPSLDREAREVERGVDGDVSRLLGHGGTGQTESSVARAWRSYRSAQSSEFALLRAGRSEQARVVDADQVDPAFDRLRTLVRDARAEHEARAESASRRAEVGSALTVVLASLLIVALLWKLHWVQRSAAEARAKGQALRQSEAKLQSLVENSSDLTTVIGDDTTISFQSDSSAHVLGYRSSELRGTRLVELVHPDDVRALLSLRDDPSSVEGSAGLEYRLRHRNGRWVHVECRAALLEDGTTWGSLLLSARDVTDRKAAEQRLAAQYAVARVLAETATLAEAAPRIIEVVCSALGWELGGLWVLDRDADVLRFAEMWQASPDRTSAFEVASREISIARGAGLPGEVWARGEPVWLPDLPLSTNFPRAEIAARSGFHAAFAVPILLGTEFLGVLDFFSSEIREPDEDLLSMMAAIGSQLGQFIERKENEDAVRGSEARTRAMLDSALDCVITIDHEGKIVEFNPAAERTFGYAYDDVVGKSMAELIVPPSLREAHYHGITRYLETGESTILDKRVEVSAMRANGSEFLVEVAISRVRLSDPPLFTAYVRDISEKEAAEQALEQSEEKLRTLVSNLPGAVFRSRLDNDWTKIFLSDEIKRISGYPVADFLENRVRTFASLIHRDDMGRVERDVRAAVTTARAYSVEYRIRHADGGVRWVSERGQAVRGLGGHVLWLDGVLFDVTERKAMEEALERQAELNRHQALHDALTGLPNRTLFSDRIEQAIHTSRRGGRELALLIMDLDRFKEINDTLGHDSGDLLLQELGRRLRATVRGSDTVCRLGGDEFGLLFPLQSEALDVPELIKRVRGALEHPFVVEGLPLLIEASLGVAIYPSHAEEADALLRRAEVAMYMAKESEDSYALYDAERDEHDVARLKLVGELRGALASGELDLYYQPKANLRTGQVEGVEALLRWSHPVRGAIPPSEFIPAAEQTGLIKPLSLFVLDTALRQCREWKRSGSPLDVAVNLSARNLLDVGLPGEIRALLARWGVEPARLALEITETAIVSDPFRARAILEQLKEIGVTLSIDDFGTGYSSLALLKGLPVDEIKIDRSFVSGMTTNKDDAAIVRSVIELGRNLGLTVVAEGVETQEAYETLAALGCDAAQGYYLSKPVPAEELASWLRQDIPIALEPHRQREATG